MAFDGIICSSIVNELNNSILDGKINKIYEPNKNQVIFGIYSKGKSYALNVSIDSANYRMNLTTTSKPNPKNAFNFCMVLRKHLIGSNISKIYMKGLERIVYIDVICYNELNDLVTKTIIIELMGKHSNIILTDSNNEIIDSLRHLSILENSSRNIMPGYKYASIENIKLDFFNLSFDKFYNLIKDSKESSLSNIISKSFTGFSKFGINCILSDLNIEDNINITLDKYKTLYKYIKRLNSDYDNFICISEKNNYYLTNKIKNDVLQVNFFIDDFYLSKETSEMFSNTRNNILKMLLVKLNKLKDKLKLANNTLFECKNMDIYKLYGELIISNLYRIDSNHQKKIALENYYDNNNLINIPLDETISPSDNAKKYFKKYKKLQNAYSIVQKQKEVIQSEIEYLDSIIYDINNAENIDELYNIKDEIADEVNTTTQKSQNTNKSKKDSSNFPTEYKIDGFTILVGKNSKQNDFLTCKLAKSTDLWFHTQDIHSSHVVLKIDKNIKKIPDSIIYKCATITAYFSKAKLSQNVPVDYTYIKYVKKPNGSKPGFVIYTDNKTLFVNPKSPNEYKN